MEGLALDAFLSYTFLSQVRFSPDGRRVAFVVSHCDKEENGYTAAIYLYEQGKCRRLTAMDKESSFFWEDGEHLLFPAVRSKQEKKKQEAGESFTAFYRIAVDGGEALPAFTLPYGCGELFKRSDGGYYTFSEVDILHPELYRASQEELEAYKKEAKENEDYTVLEENPFCENGGSFKNKKRNGLFLFDPKTGESLRLSAPESDVGAAAELNGKLYFIAETYKAKPCFKAGLYVYDPKTGETENLIPEEQLFLYDVKAYDGGLLLMAAEGKRHSYDEIPYFYTFNTNNKERTLLRALTQSPGCSVGSDCRRGGGYSLRIIGESVYYTATVRNSVNLYRLNRRGELKALLEKEGSLDCFDVSTDGEILGVGIYGDRLQELYEIKAGEALRVSGFNDEALAGKYVSSYQKMNVPCGDTDIDGWVLLPKDYDESKRYPAVFDIHGGPRTVYGEVFFHEMQYWAGKGYFVFFCNPTGSDGRGDDFADIHGHFGERDYEDLMDFTRAVLKKYPAIDKDRVAVTGGSYGGFMTNWIIGHTDIFCCAATQRSISNWVSMYGISDIGLLFTGYQTDGSIFENPERMWRQSPLKYAANFKTPTLIIHSDSDYRCPIAEGYQLLTALIHKGVEARMVVFKGENHELSRSGKPLHRVRRLKEITEWFDSHTTIKE